MDYLAQYMAIERSDIKRMDWIMVARLECYYCDHEMFRIWSPFDPLSGVAVPPPIERCPNCNLVSVWGDFETAPFIVRADDPEADKIIDGYIAQYTRT